MRSAQSAAEAAAARCAGAGGLMSPPRLGEGLAADAAGEVCAAAAAPLPSALCMLLPAPPPDCLTSLSESQAERLRNAVASDVAAALGIEPAAVCIPKSWEELLLRAAPGEERELRERYTATCVAAAVPLPESRAVLRSLPLPCPSRAGAAAAAGPPIPTPSRPPRAQQQGPATPRPGLWSPAPGSPSSRAAAPESPAPGRSPLRAAAPPSGDQPLRETLVSLSVLRRSAASPLGRSAPLRNDLKQRIEEIREHRQRLMRDA
eukprot:TRINITY_DN31515_c0_g1_i1.p1 TRINITY_DN31515_c0_g1~~TRINITY_DN31515_c0_g1_i1.p1  ORF type:complete len:287 (+),score=79.29 TRINITY_DN31515_c0_g1_i1:76-861(+)